MKSRRQLLVCAVVLVTFTTIYSLQYVRSLSLKASQVTYHKSSQLEVLQSQGRTSSYDELVRKLLKASRGAMGATAAVHYVDGYDYKQLEIDQQEHAAMVREMPASKVLEASSKFNSALTNFLASLLSLIHENAPLVRSINDDSHYAVAKAQNNFPNRDGRVMLYGGHLRENYQEEPVRTTEMLSNYLRLSKEEVDALRASHQSFVNKMPLTVPRDVLEHSKVTGYMHGDGIVFLAGGRFNQLALVSIKMLRDLGSKLPIEVVVKDWNPLDARFCEDVLPSLGASCKVLDHYLGRDVAGKVKSYQLKNLALLISSFQRVLYLDADNLLIKNPDSLFVNEPFVSTGFVSWPDLWRRSTSPSFYNIADIPVDSDKRVRNSYFKDDPKGTQDPPSLHDCEGTIPEASSETGQILIDKKKHFPALVLAMYYNYYGFDYYYPLLSQGAAGEGDKETFIAAAHKLNLPYYQVQEFNREFGPMKDSKQHHPFGMGQYDPILDFIQSQNGDGQYLGDSLFASRDSPTCGTSDSDSATNNYHYHLYEASSLMFLHANWPKLYFGELLLQNGLGRGPVENGAPRRLYGPELKAEAGYDFELAISQAMDWCYCSMNVDLHDVPAVGSDDRKEGCKRLKQHMEFLKEN
ncbi:Alpha-12-mannosyltransferase MNN24 [Meyerozyma sp. JA9]|nr:Alpha-12-mannosyltransferase MNN24 [Meyerozyma sp. JA9]